jgi:hypothetical protein
VIHAEAIIRHMSGGAGKAGFARRTKRGAANRITNRHDEVRGLRDVMA